MESEKTKQGVRGREVRKRGSEGNDNRASDRP